MNYRFLKVTSYYGSFLEYFYNRYPDILSKSFDEHLKLLLSGGFGWGNFFQLNLNKLGNEAHEMVYNADKLQFAWTRENNTKLYSKEEIFLNQLKKIKPEILFLQDVSPFSRDYLNRIRAEVPSIKKIIGWLCSPFGAEQIKTLASCDFVFSCSELFISRLKSEGIKCYRLNHAFEKTLLPQIESDNTYSETDFLFVGSLFPGSELHDLRVEIIEGLLKEKINMKIYSQFHKIQRIFLKRKAYQFYQLLKRLKLESIYDISSATRRVADYKEVPRNMTLSPIFLKALDSTPIFGIEMLKAYSKAKLGFNYHGGVAGEYASNIRLFEVTGAGACLITDHKINISDFFIPDQEVITFKTADECIEKVKWLLNHPDKRKQIAQAGHHRTLSEHTFYNRTVELDSIIKSELSVV